MNKIIYNLFAISLFSLLLISCEDERKIDIESKVYMPQSNYGITYVVPNNGTDIQKNKNYEISDNKLKIYLGVYCSGLGEMKGYSVDVTTESVPIDGTTILPESDFSLPQKIIVEKGNREGYFNLEVNMEFLKNNRNTDFSLPVKITNVTNYELYDNLATTKIHIKTSELLEKENIE